MKFAARFIAIALLIGIVGSITEFGAQTRVRFARGRTSATVSGSLTANATRTYVLGAKSGQYLSGNVSSKNGCVKFTDGSTALGVSTQSGDNIVSITNYCRTATTFTLTLSINY